MTPSLIAALLVVVVAAVFEADSLLPHAATDTRTEARTPIAKRVLRMGRSLL
ncbi:hypothetical protein [Saccharothrix obliqua]|uniref:hypothetical protein n=1 Tax=Saccharothrix obliqua TaxID=2861747 RepID=UPI0027E2DD74|nr:hypothetical protein [Saccharothrix obliqua]